jgi:hypothetical protein
MAMPEDVSIRGQVRAYDGTPIRMIRVTAYRDSDPASELAREYTDDAGNYDMSVSSGGPVTLRFDTHYSLTNAREWHPSVVANVDVSRDVLMNRLLLKVGHDGPYMATIDALAAYQFCAVWNGADPNREYASHAAARLGMIKFASVELQEICSKLADLFSKQAHE